ncbi:MAG: hypothetical protein GY847_36480 [Proteobacteria bacterium]|nr:hypothetical protein [Pseudomonadota bacterium]
MNMHKVIFAHGLESSPNGTKATYLREHFGAIAPPLYHLGLFDQVDALEKALPKDKKCILVGSSLGGLAVLGTAVRQPDRIAHLLLLAPAVSTRRHEEAFNEAEQTRPGLRREALKLTELSIPENVSSTIIHGIEDEVVYTEDVVSLSTRSLSARLILLHDDHTLSNSKSIILSVVSRVATDSDPLVFM